jgi:iron complex outermembrane receptor protein
MMSKSLRWRFAAAASPLALAMAFASPAYAQETPPVEDPATASSTGQPPSPAEEPTAEPVQERADDTIVVTGFRASLQNAVNTKKRAELIVESISAEDIGKLPDASIAESISRLPGLTSQRLSGRSNVISIRGFSPDFSTTLLNGREQTSTGDNRAVEYDQYPAEIINQVNVYKTPMATLIGQGLSGTVDLRTIRPLDIRNRIISVGGRGVFTDGDRLNPDVDRVGWRVNALFADKFADDTIGVALAATYLNEPFQTEEFNAWGYGTLNVCNPAYSVVVPTGGTNCSGVQRAFSPDYQAAAGKLVLGGEKSYNTSTDLKRLALMGTLQFRPMSNFTSTLDLFYSDFKEDSIKRGIEVPLVFGEPSEILLPGFTVEGDMITEGRFFNIDPVVRNDLFQRHAKLYSFGWNNEWRGDNGWHAFADVSYSKTDRNELNFESNSGTGRGLGVGATDTIGFVTGGNGSRFTHQLDYSDYDLILLTSPRGWGGTQIATDGTSILNGQDGYYNNRIIDDKLAQLRGEVGKDFENSWLSGIQAGINYTKRSKDLVPDEFFVGITANTDGTVSIPVPEQFRLGTANTFFGFGPMIAYDPLELLDAGIYKLVPNPFGDVVVKSYSIDERLITPYIQANIRADLGATQLTGNFGVQAIFTEQRSVGASAVFLGTNPNGSPNVGAAVNDDTVDYVDVLPSLNLSFRMPSDVVIRFAAAREIVRSRLDDLRNSMNNQYLITTDANNNPIALVTGSSGNPELRPWRANALDLTFEKYWGTNGYVAAQFFWKDLKSYVFNQDVLIPTSELALSPAMQGNVVVPFAPFATINSPINGKGGKLYGVELAGTLPFETFIPALEGFGVTGGVSYTKSKIRPTPGAPTSSLPGYSKWVVNTTAYYERHGFNIRGSLRHRSSFVGEVSGFAANRVRRNAKAETIIDGQIGYDFQPGSMLSGLSIYLQGQNLTDEPFVTTNPGQPDQVIDFQKFGRRFLLGATYKFGAASPPPPPALLPAAPPAPPPPATQTCADGSVILATDACPAPPAPPPPPPAPERG